MSFLQGQFLVASPQLRDANFWRSVVLLLEHRDEGALGVIINRETQTQVRDVWDQVSEEPCHCDLQVSLGGPVPGPLIGIHGHPQLSESEILPGVYVTTDRLTLFQLLNQNVQPFRVFTGYAGWGPGQLERELESGGWSHLTGTSGNIFSDNVTDVWQEVLHASGQDFLRDTLGIHSFPDNVGLN